jgi:hypothetical protein
VNVNRRNKLELTSELSAEKPKRQYCQNTVITSYIMEKLFDDTLFIQKERPTKITDQQEEKMFLDLAKDCIKQQYSSDAEETIAEDLKALSTNDSGFEKAKDLEDNGNGTYEFSGDFIDWLDWIDHERSTILSENVKLWVKEHNPEPKFEKGTKLKITGHLSYQKDLKTESVVYITGVKNEEANYYIHPNYENNGGYVLAFEKVESNCEVSE